MNKMETLTNIIQILNSGPACLCYRGLFPSIKISQKTINLDNKKFRNFLIFKTSWHCCLFCHMAFSSCFDVFNIPLPIHHPPLNCQTVSQGLELSLLNEKQIQSQNHTVILSMNRLQKKCKLFQILHGFLYHSPNFAGFTTGL